MDRVSTDDVIPCVPLQRICIPPRGINVHHRVKQICRVCVCVNDQLCIAWEGWTRVIDVEVIASTLT